MSLSVWISVLPRLNYRRYLEWWNRSSEHYVVMGAIKKDGKKERKKRLQGQTELRVSIRLVLSLRVRRFINLRRAPSLRHAHPRKVQFEVIYLSSGYPALLAFRGLRMICIYSLFVRLLATDQSRPWRFKKRASHSAQQTLIFIVPIS